MKNLVLLVVLALLGAGAAFGYIKWNASRATQHTHDSADTSHDDHDGHSHDAADPDGHDADADAAAALHGGEVAAGAVLCATHRVPENIDAFCHPELIESLGFCKGHDVPEAFCTRCSPVLIAAFKVENDWCDEHELPESQCTICKGG